MTRSPKQANGRLWPPAIATLLQLLLFGCDSDPLPLVTTASEASAIAAEQCGNEFHLGQPASIGSDGDQWTVSWANGYVASVDGASGTVLSCIPKTSEDGSG